LITAISGGLPEVNRKAEKQPGQAASKLLPTAVSLEAVVFPAAFFLA